MDAKRIYSTDVEADQRLTELFGIVRADLHPIVHAVVGARADTTDNDPLAAPGWLAYVFGTRHLRAFFRRRKWLLHREENVEAVKHPDRDLKIVYQSVDLAADYGHDPRAVSGKGSGADRMIDSAQGKLFSDEELERLNPAKVAKIRNAVWFLCVSVNNGDARAELSLPAELGANNFAHFIERIFIVREGEWNSLKPQPIKTDDAIELEPVVTRK